MENRKNGLKTFWGTLALVFSLAMAAPAFAKDPRIQEELNSPPPENPLKFAMGEEAYNEAMASGQYEYVGNSKCRLCHRKFFIGRKKDPHDYAMKSFRKSKYKDEPSCLTCHATGYGTPTGFVSMKKTPRLANVQCEGCHGPGNIHVKRSKVKKGGGGFLAGADQPERLRKMCISCHTERWNRSYDDLDAAYAKYRNADPNKAEK